MRTEEADLLIENRSGILKMTKARTATLLVMTVATLAVVFSMTDAHPAVASSSEEPEHLSNHSRLVVTNVVKTIEFEVGVLDDDGNPDENMTAVNGTDFYETDIQLLNLDLLKKVVSKADEELESTTATTASAVSEE